MAKHVIHTYPDIKYLLTHKLGQGHIETFFSKIRSKSGFNNNPDVDQFRSALKSLLMKQEITPSSKNNCLELDESTISCQSKKMSKKDDKESVAAENEMLDLGQLPPGVTDVAHYIGKWFRNTMFVIPPSLPPLTASIH